MEGPPKPWKGLTRSKDLQIKPFHGKFNSYLRFFSKPSQGFKMAYLDCSSTTKRNETLTPMAWGTLDNTMLSERSHVLCDPVSGKSPEQADHSTSQHIRGCLEVGVGSTAKG